MQLYVGNLGYTVSEKDLTDLFGKYGPVEKVKMAKEEYLGAPQGWGFVHMINEADGLRAIEKLNLKPFKGRKLKVQKYRSKEKMPFKPKFGEWKPR